MIPKTMRQEIKKVKFLFLKLVVCSLIGTIAIVSQAYFFASLVNGGFIEKQSLYDLKIIIFCLIGAILVRILFSYTQEDIAHQLAATIKIRLRQRILSHMMALGPFGEDKRGDITHLLTDGIEQVDTYVAQYLPQMLYAVMIPLIMALAIIKAEPWVGIILIFTFPLIPFFMILIGKQAEKLNKVQFQRMRFLGGHFLDVLQGIMTLKVFGRSVEQIEVISQLSAEFRDSTLHVLRVAFLSALVLELIGTISTALIAVYMGVALLYDEVAFLPAFFVLLLAPEFYAPLRQLGSAFHTGMAGQTALKQMDEFLALPILEPYSGTKHITDIQAIKVEKVSYTYPKALVAAVTDVSFDLLANKRVMLVGQSGAGKSTISYLIMRLLKPTTGHITIFGDNNIVDLMDINSESWRNHIAYIPQKPHLFRGTIRQNIAFRNPSISDEKIMEAAKNAAAHDFIMAMPQGYDTVLGENGYGLSGGERQRIAIARAFLKPADILILDEISAHLDVETEEVISKSLEILMKDKLVLLIGHRPKTMHWADTLVVLKDGTQIAKGSYEELLTTCPYFKSLVEQGGGTYEQ